MTIKNITLSAIAASVVTTAAFAGTITNSGTVGLVGSEKLSLGAVTVTKSFGSAAGATVYTPTNIPATSLKNPIFKYTFGNATNLVVVDTNVSVFNGPLNGDDTNLTSENWTQIATNPQLSGTHTEVISFNAVNSNTYAYNNKKYIVANSDGNASAQLTSPDINVSVAQAATGNLTLQGELYSGDSQSQADLAPATAIAKVGPEYTGNVSLKFNNTIDASLSFGKFHDFNSPVTTPAETATTDQATFNIHRNATLSGASLGATRPVLDVFFDQNTSKYITTKAFDTVAGTLGAGGTALTNDLNATDKAAVGVFAATNLAVDTNTTLTLTAAPTSPDEIKKTVFTTHTYVTSGTSSFDIISKTTKNAGEWTIYGYNAQIPNVASTSAVDVVMKFTNRSTIASDIFFTLIDPDGTVVTLNSKDYSEIASIPADQTGTYKASTLAPLATAKDANFNASGSFSVEVSIPTTPSNVYGMASFKNLTLGQFKDLPVYNNSSNNY